MTLNDEGLLAEDAAPQERASDLHGIGLERTIQEPAATIEERASAGRAPRPGLCRRERGFVHGGCPGLVVGAGHSAVIGGVGAKSETLGGPAVSLRASR